MAKNKIQFLLFIIIFIFFSCSALPDKTDSPSSSNSLNKIILNNPFIKKNTIWSGEIVIVGIAVVKRDVILTILPGTKIQFKKIDLNNDNVGDGELVVEGKLIAKGEVDNPIVFTSFEKNPQKKDWTYVYLERNEGFIIENCIFSYAFTGLQIHYSEGLVQNNIFENNNEGLRYSTIKTLIRNNTFKNNNYGIRFEGRKSNAEISYNIITKNKYGIFSVMRSDKNGTKIINNNIFDNYKYNFLIGAEQYEDISAENNWWGSDNMKEIENFIFDKLNDSKIGKLNYIPFLEIKVENAGRKE